MLRCKRCLLPAAVPGAQLDQEKICVFCRTYDPDKNISIEIARQAFELDLEKTLESCRGQAKYDALVCLSGGKDSLFLLHLLVNKYKLNILAFTTDVNIPEIAWSNIRRTIEKLGCDHLIYRPPDIFYKKLFHYLLQHQEERGAVYTISYVYAPLFEGDALRIATEQGIPLVLAGYSPGQPEPERMVYEFSRQLIEDTDWTPPALKKAEIFTHADLYRFWNPENFPAGTQFPRYLAPFHAWPYNQEEIMKKVFDLGFVKRRSHANPIYSNYPINWLLMYSDLKHFGFNPYAPEFSALIREGKANLAYWKIMAPIVDFMIKHKLLLGHTTVDQMRWLELNEKDLKVTLPLGAYDPPLK